MEIVEIKDEEEIEVDQKIEEIVEEVIELIEDVEVEEITIVEEIVIEEDQEVIPEEKEDIKVEVILERNQKNNHHQVVLVDKDINQEEIEKVMIEIEKRKENIKEKSLLALVKEAQVKTKKVKLKN